MDDVDFLVEKLRREAQEIVNACDEYQTSDDEEQKEVKLPLMVAVRCIVVQSSAEELGKLLQERKT